MTHALPRGRTLALATASALGVGLFGASVHAHQDQPATGAGSADTTLPPPRPITIAPIDEPATSPGPAGRPTTTAPGPTIEAKPEDPWLVLVNLEFMNAYFPRGIVLEDEGLITTQKITVNYTAFKNDDLKIDVYGLTFNAFNSNATGAEMEDGWLKYWFESDFGVGVNFTFGKWTVGPFYNIFYSPSGAFRTPQEVGLIAAYDDTELLGPFALHPSLLLQVDVGDYGFNGFPSENHTLLRLYATPGFELTLGDLTLPIRFPQTLALSLKEYYQDFQGNDETFGYYKTGVQTSFPLPPFFGGQWSLSLDVSCLIFGRTTSLYYNNRDSKFIYTLGVNIVF
ncbi:MAG: hypothetical protein ACT4PL_12080 [Phycisphaerales bacterium]